MKSPLCSIDLTRIPTNPSLCNDFFSKDSVSVKKLVLSDTRNGNLNELPDIYYNWTQEIPVLTNDSEYKGNKQYKGLPSGVHCLNTFTKPEDLQNIRIESEDEISVINHFHYVLRENSSDGRPLGFVKGSFSLNSAKELCPLEMYGSDLDEFDDANTIYVGCNIEAIELAPECCGLGYGTFISKEICELGKSFLKSSLGQLEGAVAYEGLAFEPVYTIDIHSQSGYRWSEHMYENFEVMTFYELLNYTHPDYVKDVDYDPVY